LVSFVKAHPFSKSAGYLALLTVRGTTSCILESREVSHQTCKNVNVIVKTQVLKPLIRVSEPHHFSIAVLHPLSILYFIYIFMMLHVKRELCLIPPKLNKICPSRAFLYLALLIHEVKVCAVKSTHFSK
jgi:hypothetical protein